MPDQSSAADEHALLQEITAPLNTLPDNPVPMVADVDFPLVLRGYDRLAVDAYVKQTSQLVAELQATRSPEAAIRRAIERVGEQISGILQRAHDTAEQITAQSRREGEDRLQVARDEGQQITAAAEQRLKDLDVDTDRIWAERRRIVDDARGLAGQLVELAEAAAERFPPADTEPPPADTEPPAAGAEAAGDTSSQAAGSGPPGVAPELPHAHGEPAADETQVLPRTSQPGRADASEDTAAMPPFDFAEDDPHS
jgi:hypothetical protein